MWIVGGPSPSDGLGPDAVTERLGSPYSIARLYADARVSRIYAGSNENMKEIVGREPLA